MLKIFISSCLFLFTGICCYAQEEFIEPPSKKLTTLPMEVLSGGVVIIKAAFGERTDSLNFILDTGSSGISLDSSLVALYKLKPAETDRTIRGVGGVRKVSFLFRQKLKFPGLTVDSLDFHVNNYDMLTSVYGKRIDGIIGFAFLSRYIVKLNYDSLKMEVWSNGPMRYPKGGFLLKPSMGTLPVHHARIKDATTHNPRFLHDIGASLCLMLSSDFIEDSNILHKKRVMFPKEGEGLGGSIDLMVTVVKELRIGPYKFKNVPTYIFDDTYNITNYPYMAGLIGNDILRRFNSIINYSRRDIYLIPNSHIRESFDYSYSGAELYFEDEKAVLGHVSENSPAQLAGLREGDEVIAINNVFSLDFTQLKAALSSSTGKIKVIVKRDGEMMQFEYKPLNINQRKKRISVRKKPNK